MGLDAVDIVFQIERSFGITVQRELLIDLAKDGEITVGDLYNLILSELGLQDLARNSFGVNMYVWTESRRALQSVTHVPLEEIELQTPLATLFPKRVRQFSWETLRRSFRYQIQDLDYPVYLRWIGLSLAAGMVAVDQLQLWQLPKAAWLWPILGLFGLWMVSETYLKVLSILSPLRNRLPSGMRTVKDFCRSVLAANYEQICQDYDRERQLRPISEPRCHEVWNQLTGILVEVLGVDRAEITFRARLTRDLGMQ